MEGQEGSQYQVAVPDLALPPTLGGLGDTGLGVGAGLALGLASGLGLDLGLGLAVGLGVAGEGVAVGWAVAANDDVGPGVGGFAVGRVSG